MHNINKHQRTTSIMSRGLKRRNLLIFVLGLPLLLFSCCIAITIAQSSSKIITNDHLHRIHSKNVHLESNLRLRRHSNNQEEQIASLQNNNEELTANLQASGLNQVAGTHEALILAPSSSSEQENQNSAGSSSSGDSTGSSSASKRAKKTLYACEEKQLQIECREGESIQLIRANYGRFSIQICNEHGQLDWKVNCMSPSSYQIIKNSCQSRQSCQLLASNSIFGDACPGTQKYLEVHYECQPASVSFNNRTLVSNSQLQVAGEQSGASRFFGSAVANSQGAPNYQRPKQNVIQDASSGSTTSTQASETRPILTSQPKGSQAQQAAASVTFWPPAYNRVPSPLPPWIIETTTSQATIAQRPIAALNQCPELVARQIRWPATEPGMVVRMPCPSHAQPANPTEPYAASHTCLTPSSPRDPPSWAPRVQAAQCQSIWLANLTERLQYGDSPNSIISELVQRTRPQPAPVTPLLLSGWSSGLMSLGAGQFQHQPSQQQQPSNAVAGLFGDDLVQVGRIVKRLVEDSGDLLNRIGDEKQRIAFTREIVQSIAELVNNLVSEQHSDAWLDLQSVNNERQRVAGQLVQALEGAAVLLAGSLSNTPTGNSVEQETFVKSTESSYVAIRTLNLASAQQQQQLNKTLELSFPSETSTLGTKWMNGEQKFTLHLQAASQQTSGEDVKYAQDEQPLATGQTLKIVFVMIKALGAQMEPTAASAGDQASSYHLSVNSNLASFSIVADPTRYKHTPIKVDLSAPLELIFRHVLEPSRLALLEAQQQQPSSRQRCVYWDTSASQWLSDGCKLIGTNETHSTCACTHLTTFALLSETGATTTDEQQAPSSSSSSSPSLDGVAGQNQQQPKVQLDSVENELILPSSNKLLYLAKLLDGHLFSSSSGSHSASSDSGTQPRLLVYGSCLICAFLLALHLAAAAYNQAIARRLLGAIPAHKPLPQPPPPLLISNLMSARVAASGGVHSGNQQPASQSDSSPTYSSSDYSAALAANKSQLEAHAIAELNQASSVAPFSQWPGCGRKSLGSLSQLQVPIHLIVQLLTLELLLVLLVESQNYLQRARQHAPHQWQMQPLMTTPSSDGPNYFQHQQHQFMLTAAVTGPSQQPEAISPMEPIGRITWFLVLSLYYLIATLTCWLASQLIRLNYNLTKAVAANNSKSHETSTSSSSSSHLPLRANCHLRASPSTSSSMASDKSTAAAAAAAAAAGGCARTLAAGSLYNPSSTIYGNNRAQNTTTSLLHSPGGSSYSTTAPAALRSEPVYGAGAAHNTNGTQKPGSANHLLQSIWMDSTSAQGSDPTTGGGASTSSSERVSWWSINVMGAHCVPVVCVALIGWLSWPRAELFNSFAYTTSFVLQLAAWPLLVDLSSPAFSILLYYGPAVCLILAGFALLMLSYGFSAGAREEQLSAATTNSSVVNPYGSALNVGASTLFSSSSRATTTRRAIEQETLNKQSELAHYKQQQQYKCCQPTDDDLKRAKLLAIMLLALLALHSICWISFFAHTHQALNWPHSNNHLMYAFSVSNLLLVSLIVCSQARTLKRAFQLSGAGRLLVCCMRHSRRKLSAHHQHRSQASTNSLHAGVKLSPSSQSLFLISQAASQHRQQQQQQQAQQSQYGHAHYLYGGPGANYGQQQQQHHLYQQLQQQQHIYDSASALNDQRTLNMMQLMQHQHQQQNFTMNRTLGHAPMSQQHQRPLKYGGGQGEHQRAVTLKRGPGLVELEREQLLLMGQQQVSAAAAAASYRQQSGEAEGPLVAISSSGASQQQPMMMNSTAHRATFGPHSLSSQQQQQHLHHHHQHQLTGPQLFSSQSQQHEQLSSSDSPINCSTTGAASLDPNQHQYYSINNNNNQQQQQATPTSNSEQQNQSELPFNSSQPNATSGPLHFRQPQGVASQQQLHQRTSSGQFLQQQQQRHLACALLDQSAANIYDVANYSAGL